MTEIKVDLPAFGKPTKPTSAISFTIHNSQFPIGDFINAAISFLLLLRFVLFIPITLTGLLLLVGRYGGLAGYRAARLQAADA